MIGNGLARCGVLLLTAALAGCAGPPRGATPPGKPAVPVFDQDRLEFGVRSVLVDRYEVTGLDIVRCPSGQPIEDARIFSCLAVLSGESKQVRVTVRGANGTFEVDRPG
ncbi:DUF4333 domain-containing protein [Crossiella cryophila]|uniref:DUF4333 domain-containing protein n=1 Tax=Crossiella cryophila TaxID=43355 RepID=A0A7W7FW49_9PSEU|nr:DUF4333 domain-containing protein [Crossiella cryophila]MBB4679223.1 hypothetical protein [Crossiella cryophila]